MGLDAIVQRARSYYELGILPGSSRATLEFAYTKARYRDCPTIFGASEHPEQFERFSRAHLAYMTLRDCPTASENATRYVITPVHDVVWHMAIAVSQSSELIVGSTIGAGILGAVSAKLLDQPAPVGMMYGFLTAIGALTTATIVTGVSAYARGEPIPKEKHSPHNNKLSIYQDIDDDD